MSRRVFLRQGTRLTLAAALASRWASVHAAASPRPRREAANAASPSNAAGPGASTTPRSLDTLERGLARDLGPYANPDRQFTTNRLISTNITDYSGITFDAVGRRMCLFGGGHGPSQETDIRVFSLTELAWSSLYPPTPLHEMVAANCDADYGRYISTNQPTARHTYNLTLVRGRRFYMMCYRGMPDTVDPALGPEHGWGGRVCWYDFDARAWGYSGIAGSRLPWYWAAAAALDPVSQRIVIAGPNNQAGTGAVGVWIYDPENEDIVAGPPFDGGGAADMVYLPDEDRFYVLQRDGRVWTLELGGADRRNAIVRRLDVTGPVPMAPDSLTCGFAWDPASRIIGGNVQSGAFHAFDPATRAWSRHRIALEEGSTGVPDQVYHCLAFDTASGCYLFLQTPRYGAPGRPTTWAYRHAGA